MGCPFQHYQTLIREDNRELNQQCHTGHFFVGCSIRLMWIWTILPANTTRCFTPLCLSYGVELFHSVCLLPPDNVTKALWSRFSKCSINTHG